MKSLHRRSKSTSIVSVMAVLAMLVASPALANDGRDTDPPPQTTAVDDTVLILPSATTTVSPLVNDTIASTSATIVSLVKVSGDGAAELLGDLVTVEFTAPGTSGQTVYTYTLQDSAGVQASATITFEHNTAPSTTSDTAETLEDTAVTISVLANDSDDDNDTLTVIGVTNPTNGSATIVSDGTQVQYTPDANWSGTDTVTYHITDGYEPATGTITVTVTAVNDAPVTGADTLTRTVYGPESIAFDVVANDTDVEGDTLTLSTVTEDGGIGCGTATVVDNQVSYSPGMDACTSNYTYEITDGEDTGTGTLTVDITPILPTATDDTVSTTPGTPLTIDVIANDSYGETDSAPAIDTVTIRSGTQTNDGWDLPHGTVTQDGTSLIYTPDNGFAGTEVIFYDISPWIDSLVDADPLDSLTHVGKVTITVPAPPAPAPSSDLPFADIDDTNPYIDDITKLYQAGITTGTSGTEYSPQTTVTREQMASFMVRAGNLDPVAGDFFADDAGSPHEADINVIAASGVTIGCASDSFCPDTSISRGQLAAFLFRYFSLEPVEDDYFGDDNGSEFEAAINALTAAGVVDGTADGLYDPEQAVTREQMATFIVRAFDL